MNTATTKSDNTCCDLIKLFVFIHLNLPRYLSLLTIATRAKKPAHRRYYHILFYPFLSTDRQNVTVFLIHCFYTDRKKKNKTFRPVGGYH